VFAASPTSVRVETQDTFTLQLSGSGRVRYRIEALSAWLSVPSLRGEFDNMGTITVPVNRAMLMPNDLATVEIISTQGRSTITVTAPGDFSGRTAAS